MLIIITTDIEPKLLDNDLDNLYFYIVIPSESKQVKNLYNYTLDVPLLGCTPEPIINN